MSVSDEQRTLVFLPGAAGAAEFWRPVASRLPDRWRKTLLSWPGAGDQPHDPDVQGFEDLIASVSRDLHGPSDLIAQSMGGIIAIGIALRHPEHVRRLVLTATSGGIDVAELGASDWREEYGAECPNAALLDQGGPRRLHRCHHHDQSACQTANCTCSLAAPTAWPTIGRTRWLGSSKTTSHDCHRWKPPTDKDLLSSRRNREAATACPPIARIAEVISASAFEYLAPTRERSGERRSTPS